MSCISTGGRICSRSSLRARPSSACRRRGLPLAIISISSLLADQPKATLLVSQAFGCVFDGNPTLDQMRQILELSFRNQKNSPASVQLFSTAKLTRCVFSETSRGRILYILPQGSNRYKKLPFCLRLITADCHSEESQGKRKNQNVILLRRLHRPLVPRMAQASTEHSPPPPVSHRRLYSLDAEASPLQPLFFSSTHDRSPAAPSPGDHVPHLHRWPHLLPI
jgi:hypothetical protein